MVSPIFDIHIEHTHPRETDRPRTFSVRRDYFLLDRNPTRMSILAGIIALGRSVCLRLQDLWRLSSVLPRWQF